VPVIMAMAMVQRIVEAARGGTDQRAIADRKARNDRTGDRAARRTDPGTAKDMAGALRRDRGSQRHRRSAGDIINNIIKVEGFHVTCFNDLIYGANFDDC